MIKIFKVILILLISNLSLAQVPCYLPTAGLVAWYPFTGNANDSSGNGNNGVNNGATLTTDRFGNPDCAYSFNGIDNFINIANSTTLNPSEISINVWIRAQGDNGLILAKATPLNATHVSYVITHEDEFFGPNGLKTAWGGGNCLGTTNPTYWGGLHAVSNNVWHMISVTISSSGELHQYIDGVLSFSAMGSAMHSCDDVTASLRVGGLWWNSDPEWFLGKIDDIAIYNRTLTPCEIFQLYTGSCSSSSAPLTAGTITGSSSITIGSTTTLTDTTTGGTWSASNGNATVSSTGVITGVTAGTDTIYYTLINACGNAVTSFVVTVSAPASTLPCYLPTAGLVAWYPFSGNTNDSSGNGLNGINYGATLTTDRFGNTNSAYNFTYAGAGWGTQNNEIYIPYNPLLNVTNISVSTWVYPRSYYWLGDSGNPYSVVIDRYQYGYSSPNGEAWGIKYSANNTVCGVQTDGGSGIINTSTGTLNLNSWNLLTMTYDGANVKQYLNGILKSVVPYTNPINTTGNSGISIGESNQANGFWNYTDAIIDDIAIYNRALSACEVYQLYSGSCSSSSAPLTAGTITGSSSITIGSTTTLTDTTTGGTWSASNGNATVDAFGVVTGVTAGVDTIYYTVGNACGSAVTSFVVTVNCPTITLGSITGANSLCAGSVTTLADSTTGGSWSSSNTSVATISTSGVVTGNSTGTAIISYTKFNTCDTAVAIKSIVVNSLPSVGNVTGSSVVCVGASITLADSISGGSWSATNGNATVSLGVVTGINAGTDTIKYSITNSCGIATSGKVVTINPLPSSGTMSGLSSVCVGTVITLTESIAGGSWTSSNTSVATIGVGGIVTGVSAGTSTISYGVTNSCGIAYSTQSLTVNPAANAGTISGASSVCAGSNITLTSTGSGGIWSSANINAAVSSGGVVYGVSAGVDTIIYSVSNICGTATATQIITVSPLPVSGTISGPTSVCAGNTITLTVGTTGGSWISSNSTVATIGATGRITGVSAGSVMISYSSTNACGVAISSLPITVNALPNAGSITGPSIVCVGANITLSDATSGGLWTSTNTNATVVSGTVLGVSSGIDTINYVVSNGCGVATATKVVNIDPLPNAGGIMGVTSVCTGGAITLTDGVAGGTWSSTTTSVATISSVGVITALSAGTSTISYTVSNSCGSASATQTITVNPLPTAAAITGSSSVCIGSIISLSDLTTGGVWSENNGNTLVTSTGQVYGLFAGVDTIIYTVTNGCGAASVTKLVTINSLPNAGTITGAASVCTSANITLVDVVSGGAWSSSNSSIVTVGSGGIVSGISAGSATVSYTVSNGCGSATAIFNLSVNPQPSAGTITGTSAVCAGSNISLANVISGGAWSASNSNAFVSSTGVVYGFNPGTDTISYIITNTCGTASAIKVITINALPSAGIISGASTVCSGSTFTLTNSVSGGTWSSSNTSVAPIGVGGIMTGVSSGSTTVSYSVANACGTAIATQVVSVNPMPSAGTITGASSVCVGSNITLNDAITGGTWTASNSNAGISSTGVVTGISAGADTIYYTVANFCGSATASYVINIYSLPTAATVTGAAALCVGNTITLTDATIGGTWTSSNTSVATIGVGGIVSGVSSGTTTISYAVTNTCGTAYALQTITVNALSTAGTITGTTTVCVGADVTLSNTTPGGIWTASNANAYITSGGVVYGSTAGVDTIFYSVSNSCGTASTSTVVTVNPSPSAGTITGATTVCTGNTTMLTDVVSGGTWTSSNTSVATIGVGGIVSGVSSGTATISYAVTNTCGTAYSLQTITVNALPTAGTITGTTTVCVGADVTLSNTTAGGIWTASNTNAYITSGGVVYGSTAGVDTIFYSVSNSCGTASTSTVVTVNPSPSAGTITGATTVCTGNTTTLTDVVSGGTWTSSNTSVATIGVGGIVSGVSSGTATISYAVTNTCGTAYSLQTITVNALPTAGTITGTTTVCVGADVTLSNTTVGGIWAASNTNAYITSGGVVYGSTTGVDTIFYSVSNSCGTASTSTVVTVNSLPNAGSIVGATTVCVGNTTTLTDVLSGGTWTSSNTSVATIGVGGILSGVSSGTATISYVVTNTCGTAYALQTITVNALPTAGTITGTTTVCVGADVTLSNTTPGGIWTASNANAYITSGGVLYGSTAGVDTIFYSVSNSCGTASTSTVVTVNSLPNAGTITGATTVCTGSMITLISGVAGGTWSVTNTHASILGGVVTGITTGVDTVNYAVTNTCGTAIASYYINISPSPSAGTISGLSSLCAGSSITLSNAVTGGIWTASNPTANVIGGIVYGISAGIDTITYTVTNSCGVASAVSVITINPLPNAGIITGATSVCIGSNITLADAAPGGIWSATNAFASVSAGVVLGVNTGVDTILYSVTNTCGTSIASHTVTINSLPFAGTITGLSSVCIGNSITLSNPAPGGVWVASNGSALVTATGVVIGVSGGVDTIYYNVSTVCGTASSTKIVTVMPAPTAGTISGASSVCTSATITLFDAISGGTWSSSNTSVATITNSGMVTGVSPGTTTVSYTVISTCGSATTTMPVTVNTVPTVASISGSTTVCQGSNITLADATVGGLWTATNPNSTISSSGVVHGVSSGLDTLKYTVSNGCGSTTVSYPITINPLPVSGTITGASSLCVGSSITLTSTVSGGVWTASNGHLTLLGANATGVSAGVDTVTYTVTNVCGSSSTSTIITVNPIIGAGTISGPSSVCVGANISLSSTVVGGTWTASNSNAAVLSSGLVYGITAGLDTLIYSISGSCGSSVAFTYVTITPLPTSGTIVGSSAVCAGSPVTLTDAVTGGVWATSNPSVATVNTGGLVSGISTGSTIISYTVTNSCGSASSTFNVNVNTYLSAGTITGGDTICMGQSMLLSDAAPGGLWSTTVGHATITSSGLLFGISYGSDTVVYSVTNACGTVKAKLPVMVLLPGQCDHTGVDDYSLTTDINVVPNPNKGTFTIAGVIAVVGDNVAHIEVTSMLGQSVYKNQVITHNGKLNEEIQLSDAIASGMYLLSIRSGGEVKVFHIIVEY